MKNSLNCRLSDYLVDFISNRGVEHIFLLPGGGAMHLIDAAGKHPDIEPVACLHEQAAVISAEAYGRIHKSGIGVAMVTTGPGATNALTGVVGAWIESVPMVIISGQVKRADLLQNSGLRQKGVQEVDIVSMVRAVTKYAKTVINPAEIRRELEQAFHMAHVGRGGPVWLDIPLDVQAAQINPGELIGLSHGNSEPEAAIEGKVGQIMEMLAVAKRPLLLAGHGVRLAKAKDLFREVAERLQIPVVTTWNAMDLLPFDHPLNIGRPGVVALRAPNFAVQNCDLLLCIGSRLDNIITAYNPQGFARDAKKIIVDIDINEIDKLDMSIDIAIEGDAHRFLSSLLENALSTTEIKCEDWRRCCLSWKDRYRVNDGKPFSPSKEIGHYQLADALSHAIPEGTLVSTGSSGLAIEAFYTVFQNKQDQRIFLTSGLGAMGYGLPAAIGACFGNEMREMIAIESDGSLQLNIQELATMYSNQLPICLIVLNNSGYCSIRCSQRNYFEGRYVGTGPEANLFLPDLQKIADVYNLPFMRISSPNSIDVELKKAMSLPRPCIIDVQLVRDEDLTPKSTARQQPDGTLVSMPLEDMTPLLPLSVLEEEMIIPLLDVSRHVRKSEENH